MIRGIVNTALTLALAILLVLILDYFQFWNLNYIVHDSTSTELSPDNQCKRFAKKQGELLGWRVNILRKEILNHQLVCFYVVKNHGQKVHRYVVLKAKRKKHWQDLYQRLLILGETK